MPEADRSRPAGASRPRRRPTDPAQELARLDDELRRVERLLVASPEVWSARAPGVSAWSVAQQVEHLLRTARTTLELVASLAPEGGAAADVRAAEPRLTRAGEVVLRSGRIPRGVARAPDALVPPPEPPQLVTRALLPPVRDARDRLLPRADEVARWQGAIPHLALGTFGATHWLCFTRIHTAHHLDIADDILRTARPPAP